MKRNLYLVISLALVTLIFSIPGYSQNSGKNKNSPDAEIRAVLDITAEGWNNGDLNKYLSAYVPEATEMLSTGPAGGVEAIEKTMKEGFWKTGKPLQVLRYEHITVRMLGKDNALVTGQYILSGGGRPDRTGWFTTVWTKAKAGWRMIHDHS